MSHEWDSKDELREMLKSSVDTIEEDTKAFSDIAELVRQGKITPTQAFLNRQKFCLNQYREERVLHGDITINPEGEDMECYYCGNTNVVFTILGHKSLTRRSVCSIKCFEEFIGVKL